jgi:hypothetical protein
MNTATLADLLPWCADPRYMRQSLAIPRLLGRRWVATDGTAVAWCDAIAPAIDLLDTPAPDCSATIAEAEARWPQADAWRQIGVPELPSGTVTRCPDCTGLGFFRVEDDDGNPTDATALCPCDTCDGSGHQLSRILRLDCMPPARGITLDNLLRLVPYSDRIAWIDRIGPRRAGALAIQSQRHRALIMPIVSDPAQHPEVVIATKAAQS